MGTIKCHLSRILGERRISQRKLAQESKLSTYTINKLYNEKWQKIEKETIVKLCRALDITPGELFEYVPDTEQNT